MQQVASDQTQGDTNNFASGSEVRKNSSEYINAGVVVWQTMVTHTSFF